MTAREVALLESRALRASMSARTEALDKVKALALLPDGLHVTSRMVAEYYEVPEIVIRSVVSRHREELEEAGYRNLTGSDLAQFLSCNLQLRRAPGRGLAVFPRRAVLNVGMLLRDSDIARRVRTYLLDTEAWLRSPLEARIDHVATSAAERHCDSVVSTQFAELRALIEAQGRVVCAMSVRLADVQQDVIELKRAQRRRRR
jgi:ABC-type phosphate transport system auxiliary subunit